MKHSSPTHVLGLLLAAAAATSGAAQEHMDHHPHNGVRGPAPGHLGHHEHEHDHHHDHHHHDDKNAHTHGLLQMHVMGGAVAGAGGGSGVPPAAGLEDDAGAELLHPLAHYMLGFFEWTAKYGRTWGSVKEAYHALKVRPGGTPHHTKKHARDRELWTFGV